jgi:hypothetical protein
MTMKPKPPKGPLQAARKGSREAEIGMYGHPLPHHKVHESKRRYARARDKARFKKEGGPFSLSGGIPREQLDE